MAELIVRDISFSEPTGILQTLEFPVELVQATTAPVNFSYYVVPGTATSVERDYDREFAATP